MPEPVFDETCESCGHKLTQDTAGVIRSLKTPGMFAVRCNNCEHIQVVQGGVHVL